MLLIGADALSRLVDWSDRGTCIFVRGRRGSRCADGGGAGDKSVRKIHSDGEKGVSLTCEKGTYLQMDGRAVFQFALSRVPEVIREVLAEARCRSRRLMRLSFIRQTAASSTAWQND